MVNKSNYTANITVQFPSPSIVTRLLTKQIGFNSQHGRITLFTTKSRPELGPTQLLPNVYLDTFLGGKAAKPWS